MKLQRILFLSIIVMSGVLLLMSPILAATPTTTTPPGVDLTIQKLFDIIVALACYLIRVSIILMVMAVIYYGFKFLISQGDPTAVGEAKKALGWGVVGIIVIFGTYTIIKTVNNAVAVAGGGSASTINLLDCSGQ